MEMRVQQTKSPRESFRSRFFLLLILALFSPASLVFAQTTTFTYQGRFTDGGTAANGIYDMQFKLFDSPSVGAGNQIGSTITNGAVTVNSGVFTVQLDFGASGFSGADRFLEIGVRLSGDANPYTVLAPRQPLTSAVYAIRAGSTTNADTATNATQLGGVTASQYVQTTDSRLTDARSPAAGSSNYIQNSINAQAGDFNISGNGKADTITASHGYFMGSAPMLILDPGNNISPPFLKLAPSILKVDVAGSLSVGNNLSVVNSVSAMKLQIAVNGGIIQAGDAGCGAGHVGIGFGSSFSGCTNYSLLGNGKDTFINSALGGSIYFRQANVTQMQITPGGVIVKDLLYADEVKATTRVYSLGTMAVGTLGAAGNTQLCRNSVDEISTCSSSLRYKTNFAPYMKGFDIINRLRPITFDWKQGGRRDVGFGAEDVEKIDPLLVTYNDKGQVEGVKYDRISVALVNAVKEQQVRIEQQRTQLNEQQSEIAALKRLMAGKHRRIALRKHVR